MTERRFCGLFLAVLVNLMFGKDDLFDAWEFSGLFLSEWL